MPDRRPIQPHDLEILRRSLTAGALPRAEAAWLLDELTRLLHERDEIVRAIERLPEPWSDVRAVLNELHHLVSRARP